MKPLDEIVAFVEGRTSLPIFVQRVEQDSNLQAVLEENIVIRPYTNDGSLLFYILRQNPSSLSAQINIRDALSRFLLVKGRGHAVDESTTRLHNVILSQTPAWLDLPDFFLRRLADKAADLADRKAVANMIRGEIAACFRFLKKPPKWLQSPAWVFVEERPLVFVGQMDLGKLKHDTAQVFVFFDEAGGEIRTVVQVL